MPNFIFELLVEEIPHEILPKTLQHLQKSVPLAFQQADVHYTDIEYFATPRRLSFYVSGLPVHGNSQLFEQKGPSVKAAYLDGKPTKALEGFFKTYNVSADDITIRTVKGQEYIFIEKRKKGQPIETLLEEITAEIVAGIKFNEPMRWNHQGQTYEFIRPVRSITAMLDDKILPIKFFGLEAGNILSGHRQLFPKPVALTHADNYAETLISLGVLPSFEERVITIEKAADLLAQTQNADALLDSELSNTLASLTEFPHPILAEFNPEFLLLPKEVLISEMKIHQKYIPVVSHEGVLMPYYIITANIPCSDEETRKNVLAGNSRVLKARFADGAFFYEEDLKKGLEFYRQTLHSIAFIDGAGSMADKIERMQKIGLILNKQLHLNLDIQLLSQAIAYSKADLASLMVGEFPELQGIIGSYYAQKAGLPNPVASAIKEQYYPLASDKNHTMPSQALSAILALTDRLDNLLTLYAVGKEVTGSRDPYALRRQVIAVIHILEAFGWDNFSISEFLAAVSDIYQPLLQVDLKHWQDSVAKFIQVRIENILKQAPYCFSADIIAVICGQGTDNILESIRKASALQDLRTHHSQQLQILTELSKRISNILENYTVTGFDPQLLQEPAEKMLFKSYQAIENKISTLSYAEKLTELLSLEPAITDFFANIMIKTGDIQENNRLALLSFISSLFKETADFSRLSNAEK